MSIHQYPRVGVGVCIMNKGKGTVLVGKRRNSHGEGCWAFPGGHLEFGETLVECAQREVMEETGLVVANIRRGPFSEDLFLSENKHYITIIMLADYIDGEPQLLEPDKCSEWRWCSMATIPEPKFLTLQNLDKRKIDLTTW